MKIYQKTFVFGQVTIVFALGCFALLPQARAACQEGCDLSNDNAFLGAYTLFHNTTGNFDTAIGSNALFNNTIGRDNTATGSGALYGNQTGKYNTAIGSTALFANVDGNDNTAAGALALFANVGNDNTATGSAALNGNLAGSHNTANGSRALRFNTTGSDNIALGDQAGEDLTTGDHNIDIGNRGVAAEAGTIRIGRVGTQTATFIAGINGAIVPTGVAVIVDSDGHLGTAISSARFKDNIQPMDKASEAILALQPVTFRYKKELDPNGIPQFGLVAEQVEKVNPDLVAHDGHGKAYTVRYEAVNAMLLNEFLKEHQTVQELKKQVAELSADLQKVSAQLTARKSSPQIALNSQ
jgi:trimeric autotransporter adhesin